MYVGVYRSQHPGRPSLRLGPVLRSPPVQDGASTGEYLAMTFIDGPEEAVFLGDKPAKLRFFVGFTDEFIRNDGSNQVYFYALVEARAVFWDFHHFVYMHVNGR